MARIIIGKYKAVDKDREMYLGHKHEKDGKMAHEKKCNYCGSWMCYDIRDIDSWGNNVEPGFDGRPEKIHCGSSICQDYHHRVLMHEKRQSELYAARGMDLFRKLKKQGVL